MKETRWIGLLYKGINFSDKYEISEDGMIRNKSTKHISKPFDEYGVEYCMLRVNGKSYRIKIRDAQLDSGLKATKYRGKNSKSKLNEADIELINNLVEEKIKEILESR